MADLRPSDFGAYFEAVHDRAPFPWQRRLLEQVARDGRWPKLLDLPTGTGKTAAIDVALFHLALDPDKAPRRIVLVVDRRTVVDQAFRRAQHIQERLAAASDGVLPTVRERLGLREEGDSIECVQMRGGMPRDEGWAKRPDLPLVAVSTVDQVGSRLLFRGYGVSDRMRPIHAGLLGHDTLFLLDEVHLARPFEETLAALREYRRRESSVLPDRWQFVAMSATPGQADGVFSLADEDWADAQLATRLRAGKSVTSEAVKASQFVAAVAKAAKAEPGAKRVGIIVNRVATALELHRELPGSILVTGRMRPLDRRAREQALQMLVASGTKRSADAPRTLVVATQCIEAGADFDFDRVVSECASLDALRQRFGRLDRLGELQGKATGVVIAQAESVRDTVDDFVYGAALRETWLWLQEAPRDFGIEAMKAVLPAGDALGRLVPAPKRAPVMLPSHLDAWSQTAPIPRPDPDVSLWLHGIGQRPDADVQIVWRADLSEGMFERATQEDEKGARSALARIVDRVSASPPSGLEALAVPFASARAWLAGTVAPPVADVEGAGAEEEVRERDQREGRPALLWDGEDSRVVAAAELRPGMTIVVPAGYGGMTSDNWDPSSKEPVEKDLGDQARWEQSRRGTLRLHPGVALAGWPRLEAGDAQDVDDDVDGRVAAWLSSLGVPTRPVPEEPWWHAVVRAMQKRGYEVVRIDAEEVADDPVDVPYLALILRGRGDVSTEDDAASLTGVAVPLHTHMKGVAHWAKLFGERCGLPAVFVRDLEIAGRWHDAGKVDPRFQRMLRGGSPLAEGLPPLAKSAMPATDHARRKRAYERSGYPRGGRHELSSVSLVETEPALLDGASDRDLVLHLIASHHGWCRPFAPVVDDPEPVELSLEVEGKTVTASSRHGLEALDSGVADRYWRLVERYGWYGLAWLEAILRLADHRRSEQEQTEGGTEGEQ